MWPRVASTRGVRLPPTVGVTGQHGRLTGDFRPVRPTTPGPAWGAPPRAAAPRPAGGSRVRRPSVPLLARLSPSGARRGGRRRRAASSTAPPRPPARAGAARNRPPPSPFGRHFPPREQQAAMAQDPQHAGPVPRQPEQQQEPPGHTAEMARARSRRRGYRGSGSSGPGCDHHRRRLGIGRAVAIAFAREGADVPISYLPRRRMTLADTARWVEEAGRTPFPSRGTSATRRHCRAHRRSRGDEFGRLDILVNNAACQLTYGDDRGDHGR